MLLCPGFSGRKSFYRTAEVGTTLVAVGDYVAIAPDTPDIPDYVGRVVTMFSKAGVELVHVHWMWYVMDTLF